MRLGLFPAALVLFVACPAGAEAPHRGTPQAERAVSESSASAEQAARDHFERALSFYQAGKYHPTVDELNAALRSDPTGKDLVYNLALVQEKLGDFDGAIASLERFERMEKDPVELERAGQTIARLKGARAALVAAQPALVARPGTVCPTVRVRGKLDNWVLGVGGVAVVSLLLGAVFGARALALDPSGESTGPGGAYTDSHERAVRAHTAAIISDISLSVSVLAGATAATLYFGRYADPPEPRVAWRGLPTPRVTAAWLVVRY